MNTTSNFSSGLTEFYDRAFLERAIARFLYMIFGQIRPLKKRTSKTIKFRRYESLAAATTPLTEGVVPTGSNLTKSDITAMIAQYGDFITITDLLDLTNADPVLLEGAEVLGEQEGDTLDQVVRDVLAAGTSVIYANGASRAAVNTLITLEDIENAVDTFKDNNARRISSIMSASQGIGTSPIPASFFMLNHTHITRTVKGLAGFTPVHKYANPSVALPGEYGSVDEIRCLESTNGKIFAGAGATGGSGVRETTGNADVYASIILAANAYGIVPLDMNNDLYFKAFGSAGTADPLDQIATLGWKTAFTAKILNDAFMQRIEHAAPV